MTVHGSIDSHRRLLEASNDAVVVFDPDKMQFTYANENACELLGIDQTTLKEIDPVDIHAHEPDSFRQFVDQIQADGRARTTGLSCQTMDGSTVPAEISGLQVELDDCEQIVVYIRDCSTRVEQRQELDRRLEAIEAASDGIAIVSAEGIIIDTNPACAAIHGYDSPEELVGAPWTQLYSDESAEEIRQTALSTAVQAGKAWVEVDGETANGDTVAEEISITALENGDFVWVIRDRSEQNRRAEQLERLAETSHRLIGADDATEVETIAVDAVETVFDCDIVCVRTYEEGANRLEITELSDDAATLLETQTAYDLQQSPAASAYRSGETVVVQPDDENLYAPAVDRPGIHLPIGTYGVLSAFKSPGSEFTASEQTLFELLRDSIQSARERADRQRALRERGDKLSTRRDELVTVNRTNQLIRTVVRSVLRSAGQAETEETVCERLASSSIYDEAWIGTVAEDGSIEVRTRGGCTGDEQVPPSGSPETSLGRHVLTQAIAERDSIVRRQQRSAHGDSDTEAVETVAVGVPLACGDRSFGGLVVTSRKPDSLSDVAIGGLELLAEAIAFSIIADRNRSFLLSNSLIELKIEVQDGIASLSSALECRCVHQRTITHEDGSTAHRIRVEGVGGDDAVAYLREQQKVSDARSLEEDDSGCLVEIETVETPPEILARSGVSLRSIVAEDGVAEITAEAPEDADIAEIIDEFRQRYTDVRLVSKRRIERSDWSALQASKAIDAALTARQRSVLEFAFEQGYYDWPREATAEEIAASIDITAPTLHQHLRTAERKILEAILDS